MVKKRKENYLFSEDAGIKRVSLWCKQKTICILQTSSPFQQREKKRKKNYFYNCQPTLRKLSKAKKKRKLMVPEDAGLLFNTSSPPPPSPVRRQCLCVHKGKGNGGEHLTNQKFSSRSPPSSSSSTPVFVWTPRWTVAASSEREREREKEKDLFQCDCCCSHFLKTHWEFPNFCSEFPVTAQKMRKTGGGL